ncbi:phosphoglycerate mutase-like protein [Sistotremastrum suecicum HHB10207 ss-3]|uniref:Phosphoglycerate mutase-like protein n=1 Tax=Sistotremastrum suecicum HHB10207 ss-3 TaxID=1314776 RepID=A0A166GMX1_9AGAM|nr:phosphoglycerate mutase-like protein [Sistotremastrum suecicum HHB10207 ss-3]
MMDIIKTGTSDIPLTKNGQKMISILGPKVAGPGRLIDPTLLSGVMISPRIRARKTFELLFASSEIKPELHIDERVREWTYGDYEGLLVHEVAEIRRKKGLPSGENGWDIWVDGCEGGESVQQMSDRADEAVKAVKEIHRAWFEDPSRNDNDKGGDVLIVSHGHFSRIFLARWLGLSLDRGQLFVLDPGGVCVGQYYHDLKHTAVGAMNLGVL